MTANPCPRLIGSGAALLLVVAALAGCGSVAEDERTRGVPLSAELRPAIESSRRSLKGADGGDPRVRRDLDRYHGITSMLLAADRRAAASDSLHGLWHADPAGVLWPELAALYRNYLTEPQRFRDAFLAPDFPDSSSALGMYLREWRRTGPQPDGSGYGRAWAARSELSPWPRVWVALRFARRLRTDGRADEAARLALEVMPEARDLGGWRLELEAWLQIMLALRENDHLDDALHAAVMAEDLARAVSAQTGNTSLLLEVQLDRARVLADRREDDLAMESLEQCALDARAAGLTGLAERALNHAGIFTRTTGRYEEGLGIFRRALLVAVADGDSLNVPRHLANIGERHRMMGNLDSCQTYLEQAESWIRAYPDRSNLERFPLFQAEYYAELGDFAAVDSLHAVAAALTPMFSPIAKLAELHLQIIQRGLEGGRTAQVYRSIARLDSLRGRLGGAYADRNESFDLDLATAEFLGRQGLFVRASEALDRADSALARRPAADRRWNLTRARGHLARRRNDPAAAAAAYRACLATSEEQRLGVRANESRLLLASLHLERGSIDEAAAELASLSSGGAFGGGFRVRFSATILGAEAELQRGRFDAALLQLDRARVLCRPGSPPDLLARLEIESSRALAGLKRRDEARKALARAKEHLTGALRVRGTDDDVFLDSDLRRELAEAMLGLAIDGPEGALRGADAEAALHELETVLPAWHRADSGTVRPLASPQIAYFVGTGASYRWTAGDGAVELLRLPGEAALLAAMAPVLADMREPSRPIVAAEVAALTKALGGPVAGWPGGVPLTIVPDGPLFAVPWAALARDASGGSWLDQGPIAFEDAPAYREPDSPPAPRARQRLLALGADADAGARAAGLAKLRHAEREAREVCASWPAGFATLRVGDGAGRQPFTNGGLSGYDVVHVSSHALVYQGVAGEAALLLAGATGAPVTAAEIGQLDLRAELVFLSCCEAAEGVRRGVGPAHAGLARSFLAAGARNVVAPGIRVEDEAARHVAGRFYRHWLDGESAAAALRMAQLGLRDGGPRWAHPYYWAFYQAIRG